jgi:hypothetical protein
MSGSFPGIYIFTVSIKPFILPRIQIQESQTFLTLAWRGRQYFDQFEAKSKQRDIWQDLNYLLSEKPWLRKVWLGSVRLCGDRIASLVTK